MKLSLPRVEDRRADLPYCPVPFRLDGLLQAQSKQTMCPAKPILNGPITVPTQSHAVENTQSSSLELGMGTKKALDVIIPPVKFNIFKKNFYGALPSGFYWSGKLSGSLDLDKKSLFPELELEDGEVKSLVAKVNLPEFKVDPENKTLKNMQDKYKEVANKIDNSLTCEIDDSGQPSIGFSSSYVVASNPKQIYTFEAKTASFPFQFKYSISNARIAGKTSDCEFLTTFEAEISVGKALDLSSAMAALAVVAAIARAAAEIGGIIIMDTVGRELAPAGILPPILTPGGAQEASLNRPESEKNQIVFAEAILRIDEQNRKMGLYT